MNAPDSINVATATPLRQTQSLDGIWDFRHDSDAEGHWRTARVPGPWGASCPDLAVFFGTGTYRRRFSLPDAFAGREVALCFGAVNEMATVWLNGSEIGRHEGGYLPFEILLPPALLRPENELTVTAHLPDARHDGRADFAEIPHGKQSWYGPQGGIWQSVRIEARDRMHIAGLRLHAHWPTGLVDVAVRLSVPANGTLRLEVTDPDGRPCGGGTVAVEGDSLRHSLAIPAPRAWSPDTPELYAIRATLTLAGGDCDIRTDTFGFRSFTTRDGVLMLNDRPFYLRGALDQDYYPDGFGLPPSTEFLEDQAMKAKRMGLNCLRLHIKVPDPRYYEVADRVGLVIWTEIPSLEVWSPAAAERLRATMEGILARDGNHPSICIWTLINEDWGTRLGEVAEQRTWLAGLYDWLKAEDPLRLVVDNSPCFPNMHVKTDINDYHFYRTMLERPEEWIALCHEFAGRARWTFSSAPEARETGQEPLILSEFGIWGLPNPRDLKVDGADPWWALYGATWVDGCALPLGIEARFAELGLGEVFGGLDGFVEQVQWAQWANLKAEIEIIRTHAPIAGYVVTELTDVHWEANGLMDMARNPRVFAAPLAEVNADVMIAPGLMHPSAVGGQTLPLDLRVATGGVSVPAGSRLTWQLGDDLGSAPVGEIGAMQIAAFPASITAPQVDAARVESIRFGLTTEDGRTIASNRQDIAVYPPRPPSFVTMDSADPQLAQALQAAGFQAGGDALVVRGLTPDLVEAIHAGARVIQVPAEGQYRLRTEPPEGAMPSPPYFTFPDYGLHQRDRSVWRGDWVGNFSWLSREGAFAHLPGGPMLDLSFARVAPRQVLTGLRPWEYHGRVHAGVVVGWVHKPAGILIEKRFGRGKLVLTTFRLDHPQVAEDPVALALWDGIAALIARP